MKKSNLTKIKVGVLSFFVLAFLWDVLVVHENFWMAISKYVALIVVIYFVVHSIIASIKIKGDNIKDVIKTYFWSLFFLTIPFILNMLFIGLFDNLKLNSQIVNDLLNKSYQLYISAIFVLPVYLGISFIFTTVVLIVKKFRNKIKREENYGTRKNMGDN